MPRPPVLMLTCPRRSKSAMTTVHRWMQSDWRAQVRMIVDDKPEVAAEAWGTPARGERLVRAFSMMLRSALERAGSVDEWILFLADDLAFHPRIGSLVEAWAALKDERCVMASLFNPSLQATAQWGGMPAAFAADPETFQGAQAILLRRKAVVRLLQCWTSAKGTHAQRMARILGQDGPIWVHRPSLVQHVAEDSSWGAKVQTASDFNSK